MDRELLVQELCDAEHKKRKAGKDHGPGNRKDDNSMGKVLRLLGNAEGDVHPTDLCQKLEVTTPRITVILNEMEEKGLVERQISKEDRRKIVVVLTDKGKEAMTGGRRRHEEYMRTLIERIGEADAEAYLRVMKAEEELLNEMKQKDERR